jgi:hypothetical protein
VEVVGIYIGAIENFGSVACPTAFLGLPLRIASSRASRPLLTGDSQLPHAFRVEVDAEW